MKRLITDMMKDVISVNDSSYYQENSSIAGEIMIIGNEHSNRVSPIYRIIRMVCTSRKAAETHGVMKVVDDAVNTTQQLSILINDTIDPKVFIDLRPLLESLWSTKSGGRKST